MRRTYLLKGAAALFLTGSAGAATAQAPAPAPHYFAGQDLRNASESMACSALEKVFADNSLIQPVDYKDNCLSAIFDIRSCSSYSDYLYEEGICAKNRSISIRLSKDDNWLDCKPRKIGDSSYNKLLACGGVLRLTGSIPAISSLATLSGEAPQYSDSYGLALTLSNSKGESDTAYPYYSMVSKIEIGTTPRVKKENLVYKYYFPAKLQIVSKYLLDDGKASLYVKSEADTSLYLGSREKNLIN